MTQIIRKYFDYRTNMKIALISQKIIDIYILIRNYWLASNKKSGSDRTIKKKLLWSTKSSNRPKPKNKKQKTKSSQ